MDKSVKCTSDPNLRMALLQSVLVCIAQEENEDLQFKEKGDINVNANLSVATKTCEKFISNITVGSDRICVYSCEGTKIVQSSCESNYVRTISTATSTRQNGTFNNSGFNGAASGETPGVSDKNGNTPDARFSASVDRHDLVTLKFTSSKETNRDNSGKKSEEDLGCQRIEDLEEHRVALENATVSIVDGKDEVPTTSGDGIAIEATTTQESERDTTRGDESFESNQCNQSSGNGIFAITNCSVAAHVWIEDVQPADQKLHCAGEESVDRNGVAETVYENSVTPSATVSGDVTSLNDDRAGSPLKTSASDSVLDKQRERVIYELNDQFVKGNRKRSRSDRNLNAKGNSVDSGEVPKTFRELFTPMSSNDLTRDRLPTCENSSVGDNECEQSEVEPTDLILPSDEASNNAALRCFAGFLIFLVILLMSDPWSSNLVAIGLCLYMYTPSPGTPVDQFKEDTVVEQPPRQEERVQKDRSLDVYPETLRQRQRPRNMAPSPSKVDIKNWNQNGSPIREPESPASGKKFLPSVKALRSQFETGKNLNSSSNNGSVSPTSTFSMSSSSSNASTGSTHGCGIAPTSVGGGGLRAADPIATLSRKLSGSSLASSSLEKSSSNTSLNSAPSTENMLDGDPHDPDEPVEPIFCQFQKVDEELRELMSRPTSTSGWDPRSLLKRLYYVPEAPRVHSKGHSYISIEGYLEKLPSGRKKATFWNAWKRRYFVAKDGVLYYYQNSQCDKQSLKLTLMGGKVETMEGNMVGVDDGVETPEDKSALMLGVDDGKGHYVVVRCSSRSEADRWRRALESHLVEDFASQYVQPNPMPTNPSLFRDTLIIDIGSCSVRAGVLSSQATLPQLFFPSVVATDRESRRQVWGQDALAPETRTSSSLSFPMKPSHRISKYSVDLTAVSSLLAKTFSDLKVDPKNYNLQISVPRVLNQTTQSELLRTLFEKFGVKGVNVTNQSILALYAYNATSGIVVDIGERMDIVPVIDGYIVEGGVSRVPYGGCRILDHLRQFLYLRNVSLVNDVESYIIRHVLESSCYCAQHYNTEKARCTNHPENFEKTVSLKEFFPNAAQCPYDAVELDFGRFQATEGLFNPDAWGLDHPGLHKLVHKAIQECSMDIRKEMSRSIFLAGGVTQLPGLADRLTTELDNLTPPAIRPKVHVSPYRYHAAYIGACTLAESPAFSQTLITRENWAKNGNAALRKWAL